MPNPVTNKFDYISLFSGIGGFEQALAPLGGRCVLSSEIDETTNKAYEILYGERTQGDVSIIPAASIPSCDLLVAGFPCQAFSSAGARRGFHDTRGTLFYEVLRVLKHAEPSIFVLENVKGLLSHDSGNTLQTILGSLATLPYVFDYTVLNTLNYGLPQNRERFILVGVHKRLQSPESWTIEGGAAHLIETKSKIRFIHNHPDNLSTFNFDFPEKMPLQLTLSDLLDDDVPDSFYFNEERTQKIVDRFPDAEFIDGPDTLYRERPQILRAVRTAYGKKVRKQYEAGELSLKRSEVRTFVPRENDISNTLTTVTKDNLLICYENGRHRIRTLTPGEYLKLQGFKPSVYASLAPFIPKTKLYRMAGNAVSVPVVHHVLRHLVRYIEKPIDKDTECFT